MAFGTASKIFTAYITDISNNTTSMDMNTDTLKATLYGNTGTPDQTDTSAHCAYNGAGGAWVTANEVTATGWPAGGVALTGVTSTFTTNVYKFDATDTVGGVTDTVTNAYGCLVYDSNAASPPVTSQAMCYNAFGGATSVVAGTFTIVWNSSGIFTWTV